MIQMIIAVLTVTMFLSLLALACDAVGVVGLPEWTEKGFSYAFVLSFLVSLLGGLAAAVLRR